MELTTLNVLAVWIEEMRPEWAKRGVAPLLSASGAYIWNGAREQKAVLIAKMPIDEPEPPPYVLLHVADLGIDHCKVLIENAVEQVAGR